MSAALPPWVDGPFELLIHAEGHLRDGEDFDRRIALISFDNAIEVAIATYLTLNPIQRGNRPYAKTDVDRWMSNYHSKLDFIDEELRSRSLPWQVERSHIVFAHDHRNQQYHGGNKGIPEKRVLDIVRSAALWIFGLLFDIANAEAVLNTAIIERTPPPMPTPERLLDLAIDAHYGVIQVGEESYRASELLFAVDRDAYRDLGTRLDEEPDSEEPNDGAQG